MAASGFAGKPGDLAFLPADDGSLAHVLAGRERLAKPDASDANKIEFGDPRGHWLWAYAGLPSRLPAGIYRIDDAALDAAPAEAANHAALGWVLGSYEFHRYKSSAIARSAARKSNAVAALVWPARADHALVGALARHSFWARDLINTPALDLGPAELAAAARALAKEFGARCRVISGAALKRGFPAVHGVGQGSVRPPCLIDLVWGDPRHLKVTLVGKGVVFDSGGLDLKPESAMKLMKKDMAGAAHALALGAVVMETGLKVRLRVIVPAVENSISGSAIRPLDVLKSRKGLNIEVGNTDAEGRLILADALAAAAEEKPSLVIDWATLTGAARVALGLDLPALFSNDDALAEALLRHGAAESDPLWRLPLWQGYRNQLDSRVADLSNVGTSGYAGAILAALFLESFVTPRTSWAHIDMMAWNMSSRPGRPEGGEVLGLRAAYAAIAERAAKASRHPASRRSPSRGLRGKRRSD